MKFELIFAELVLAAANRPEIKERIRYVEVQKIVEKPIYHNVCLDDDGLQLINEAVSGVN